MSIRVMSLVWESYPGGGSELLALLALADWSDDNGKCYPSMAAIAKKTRLSRSQSQRVVHQLIEGGFVAVVGNETGGAPGSTRQYRVNLHMLTGRMGATGSAHATGRTHAQEGSHGCGERGSAHATQTVIEPPITVRDGKSGDLLVGIIADIKSGKPGKKKTAACPYQLIEDAYHANFPSGPKVTILNDKRKRAIAARWREVVSGKYRAAGEEPTKRTHEEAMRFFARYFAYCEELDWCAGRTPMKDGGYFRAKIDNLMGADFMAKRSDEAHDLRDREVTA